MRILFVSLALISTSFAGTIHLRAPYYPSTSNEQLVKEIDRLNRKIEVLEDRIDEQRETFLYLERVVIQLIQDKA